MTGRPGEGLTAGSGERRRPARRDGFLVALGLFGALAAGLAAQSGPSRGAEVALIAAGIVLAYVLPDVWAWAATGLAVVGYLALEWHRGTLDRAHYWVEILYVTGIVCACVAAHLARTAEVPQSERLPAGLAPDEYDRTSDELAERLRGGRRLDALELEVERSRRHNHAVSLLVVRPDEFDDVAVKRGDRAADEVLHEVAASIGANLRATDAALRRGPFDFWVILPETGRDGARIVAERMRLAIGSKRLEFGPADILDLSVSIGVATFPEDAITNDDLIAAAQRGLGHAVERGGNRSVPASALRAVRAEPLAAPGPGS